MVALTARRPEKAGDDRLPLKVGSEVIVGAGEMRFIIKGWFDLPYPATRLLNVRVETPKGNGWGFHHTAMVDVGNWSNATTIPVRYLEAVVRRRLAEMD